jgi:hypothetical protein
MTFTVPAEEFYGENQYQTEGRFVGWLELENVLIVRQAVDGSGPYKDRCVPVFRCGNANCLDCSFAAQRFFAETIADAWRPDGSVFAVSYDAFVYNPRTFVDTDATVALALNQVLGVVNRVPLKVAGGFHLVCLNNADVPWCFQLHLLVGRYDGDELGLREAIEEEWFFPEVRVQAHDTSREAIVRYLLDATFPNVARHLHDNPDFRADQPKREGDRKKLRQWLYGPARLI